MEVYLVLTRELDIALKYYTPLGIINDSLFKRTLDVLYRLMTAWSTSGKQFDI